MQKNDKQIRETRNSFLVKVIAGIIILTFFVIVPFFAGTYVTQVILYAFITAYLCGAWNIAGGYGGLLSFGHAAFVGIGAYTTAVLLVYYGIPGWIGMLFGGLLGAFLGWLLAWSICRFKLKGFYFAVSTILLAETIGALVARTEYFGKGLGIVFPVIYKPFNLQFIGITPYYYLSLVLVCLSIIITYQVARSKLGWYLRATRQGEEASSALGVDVAKMKTVSMTLSSFLTGVGGGFYVLSLRYCSPYDVFGIMLSTILMLGTLLGGRGTVLGPIVGIFLLTAVKEGLAFASEAMGVTSSFAIVLVVWGAILCLIAKFLPNGLIPWIRGVFKKVAFSKEFALGSIQVTKTKSWGEKG